MVPALTTTHAVFAYGSNMHVGDLERWHAEQNRGRPQIYRSEIAHLDDHRLCWNYHSRSRGAGAANVEPARGHRVTGLLLHVDRDTLAGFDLKEGHPDVYERQQHTLRVGTLRIDGWVYVVTDLHRQPSFIAPRRGYRELMLEAAQMHGFAAEYTQELLRVEVID